MTITSLTDDVYGNIANQGTCVGAVGTVLAPRAIYSCSFTANLTGRPRSQTDVVTVIVSDDDGTTATDTDDATVRIAPVSIAPVSIAPVAAAAIQNLARPQAGQSARAAQATRTLPRTGAGVADLVTLALGLVAFGGLMVLTASRWTPSRSVVARRRMD